MNDFEVLESAPEPLGSQVEKAFDVMPASETSRCATYEFKKPAAKFTGVDGIQWQTRDVADPGDEAQEGVDGVFDADGDVSPDGFLKMLEQSPDNDTSETLRHLTKCGVHLLKAQAHNVEGDHDECHASLNKALFHFSRAHQGLKAALS
jgi:hypothetical protein